MAGEASHPLPYGGGHDGQRTARKQARHQSEKIADLEKKYRCTGLNERRHQSLAEMEAHPRDENDRRERRRHEHENAKQQPEAEPEEKPTEQKYDEHLKFPEYFGTFDLYLIM